jgi:hypothetical protein
MKSGLRRLVLKAARGKAVRWRRNGSSRLALKALLPSYWSTLLVWCCVTMSEDGKTTTCGQCDLPLIELDAYGERLRGCVGCNQWQSISSGEWRRLKDSGATGTRAVSINQTLITCSRRSATDVEFASCRFGLCPPYPHRLQQRLPQCPRTAAAWF